MNEFKTYLFSYNHNGKRWGFELPATSQDDARVRLSKIACAKLDGELVASIPMPSGLVNRLLRWANESVIKKFFTTASDSNEPVSNAEKQHK